MPPGWMTVTLAAAMQVGQPSPSEQPNFPPLQNAFSQHGFEGQYEQRYPFDTQQNWVHGYHQEIPAYGGYPVFRPYNYKDVLSQSQTAAGWGMSPTMPYSQQFWHRYHDQATMLKLSQQPMPQQQQFTVAPQYVVPQYGSPPPMYAAPQYGVAPQYGGPMTGAPQSAMPQPSPAAPPVQPVGMWSPLPMQPAPAMATGPMSVDPAPQPPYYGQPTYGQPVYSQPYYGTPYPGTPYQPTALPMRPAGSSFPAAPR